jgi:hypothetical protein
VVEVEVLRVHVHPALAEPDRRHVRVAEWEPLFYVFRHYVARGPELGRTFRATTSDVAADDGLGLRPPVSSVRQSTDRTGAR